MLLCISTYTNVAEMDKNHKQQEAVWTRIAKDRESWMTLAEGYFLQWKDIA